MRRLLALAAMLLTGCSHSEPLSLHGAASMRIEVEVYKGPLSVPIPGQMGELVGVLSDSIHAVYEWRERANRVAARCGSASPSADCVALKSAINTSEDIIEASCYIIGTTTLDKTVGRAVYIPVGTCKAVALAKAERVAAGDKLPPYKLETEENRRLQTYYEDVVARMAGSDRRIEAAKKLDQDIDGCIGKYPVSMVNQLRCQGDVISVAFENLASILNGAAQRASSSLIPEVPSDDAIRGLVVEYASMTSGYGRRIHARITVLQRQMAGDGGATPTVREARTLPMSDFLLDDSGSTNYLELSNWFQASKSYGGDELGVLTPAERIEMARQLANGSYWQKVNEVYASGQGDVAMAFVKDDLGNWDLKSFSNDPSELLASYRKVTDAALKTAASLAARAGSGGLTDAPKRLGEATRAANLANQLATGEVPGTAPTVAGMDVGALHDRTAKRIADQKLRFEAQQRRLEAEKAQHETDAAKAAGEKGKAENTLATDTQTAKNERNELQRLNGELSKKLEQLADAKENDGDVDAAQTAVDTAQRDVVAAQGRVTKADEAASKSMAARDALAAEEQAATVKAKATERRLADLPKDAIQAVRDTLDDHMAVVNALQEGIAGPPPEPDAPTRPLPTKTP